MARGRKSELGDIGHELNLIPYLDIMVNLVLFMLVTITSFLSFTMLNASIPQIAPNTSTPPPMQKAQLLLMVRVTSRGFDIDPSVQGGGSLPRKNIPKKGEAFDFASLQSTVVDLKKKFENETRVLMICEPKIIYDDIIHSMDALRETIPGGCDPTRPPQATDVQPICLFPDVTLSVL